MPSNANQPGKLRRHAGAITLASSAPLDQPAAERLRSELDVREAELELRHEELQSARAALEAAFDEHSRLFDCAPIGFLVVDARGAIESVNIAGARILGLDRTRFFGLRLGALVAAADASRFSELLATASSQEAGDAQASSSACEIAARCAGGDRVLRMTATKVPPPGETAKVLLAVEDVTDRVRAEEQLRREEEKYRALFEHSLDAVYLISATGTFLDANAAACRMHGMTVEEIRQRGCAGTVVKDERHAAAVQQRAATGTVRAELTHLRKDGTTFPAEVQSVKLDPLRSDSPAFVIARDITDRKQAEEQLAADLAALTRMHALSGRLVEAAGVEPLLQETVDAAVAIMAADKGTLQLLDGGTLRIVAYLGHEGPFLDFHARAESVACVCGEAMRRGERVFVPDVETRPALAGNSALPVLRAAGVRAVQSTPLRTRAGRLLGVLTTHWTEPHTPDEHDLCRLDLLARQAADLIEQKQAEEALRESDRRKDEFLAMLSHELRNPLAPIRSAAYILEHADPGGEQAGRARSVLRRQSEHLTRLVDDLLDVNRITTGKIRLQRSRIDVRESVVRAADDVRGKLAERGVEFRTAVPPSAVRVDADPTRIHQMLVNLLNNAAKFTRRGDEVDLSLTVNGHAAEVRVRDSGAGIDPQLLAHLFEPFVQGDRTLARSEGGLGLGLALVKGIVDLHGGEVRAVSAGIDKGSEFVVRLPLLAAPDAPAPASSRFETRRARQRVLVVDDNVDAAASLADLLRMFGHEVDVAHDGPAALAKLAACAPDVVLCDIGLPGMSGYEVARAMRANGNPGVRLVALSGYAQPEDVKRSLEAGFEMHVAKPPDPDELARLLG